MCERAGRLKSKKRRFPAFPGQCECLSADSWAADRPLPASTIAMMERVGRPAAEAKPHGNYHDCAGPPGAIKRPYRFP